MKINQFIRILRHSLSYFCAISIQVQNTNTEPLMAKKNNNKNNKQKNRKSHFRSMNLLKPDIRKWITHFVYNTFYFVWIFQLCLLKIQIFCIFFFILSLLLCSWLKLKFNNHRFVQHSSSIDNFCFFFFRLFFSF